MKSTSFLPKPRSFVLRKGRVTNSQRSAIDNYWDDYVVDPELKLIDFRSLFNNDNSVVLDIGFGSGETLIHLASTEITKNFLGIEVYLSGVGTVLSRAKQDNLENIKIINMDAEKVLPINIKKKSLGGILLFYPDPWPKRKHNKRRIIQDPFLRILQERLKKNTFFYCKTDWKDYALHIVKTFNLLDGWKKADLKDLDKAYRDIPPTSYENKALKAGRKLVDLVYIKT